MTDRIEQASAILLRAYLGGDKPGALPEDCTPGTAVEAHRIQDSLARQLRQDIVGWKVGKAEGDTVLRGALLQDRVMDSPAEIPAAEVPLLGIEPEIAFRLDRTLEPRDGGYSDAEVRAAVTAFVAIEVVDSRFASYQAAPFMDRLADFMSNGALICGSGEKDWHGRDFTKIEVIVRVNGQTVSRDRGGHASGDPLMPGIELLNDMTRTVAVEAGTILTTGTFIPLQFVSPGDTVKVEFVGFGSAEVTFPA